MRKSLLAATLLVASLLQAQEASLLIVPRWKVGDSRTLDVTQVTHEDKAGTTGDDRTMQHIVVRVVNEDPKAYILRMQCDNPIVGAVTKLGGTPGQGLDPFKQVMLRYSVSKYDGRPHLENWEEVQKFMRKSFDVTMASLKQDTAAVAAAGLLLLPVMDVFKSREGVEEYFSEVINYVTFPFGKRIADNDTLKATSYCRNPFNPTGNDSIPVRALTHVQQIDRLQQQAVVRRVERTDFSAFVDLMKGMMRQSMASAKVTPADRKRAEAKMEAELKGMRFDMDTEALYTMDLLSTWPLAVKSTVRMTATSGSTAMLTTTTTDVTVTK
ncbi:MAG TPA: hypothetical protein VHL57_11535 [Flavobacteriales bacterium]|jgi:hypothetical protein|nr:hypothetical protein [Flavobacteriales bacterium]